MSDQPNFQSRNFLVQHIRSIMDFYHPACLDPDGGFFHFYKDDGHIYDKDTRHLVSSCRFIFNYAMAFRHFKQDEYLTAARHGLTYLRDRHKRQNGGYVWLLAKDKNLDETNHCYGLAFVLLAYSTALSAGIEEARPWIKETFDLMERHFWEAEHGLYADEASADWQTISSYRGQNANMHTCEAMIAAYDATGENTYLERAMQLAHSICVNKTELANGHIWEHYNRHWQIDWDYNKEDPKHLFRPWGFQPGHQTEWSKLLLLLAERTHEEWLIPTAERLFDFAWQNAWDDKHGGLHYGYSPNYTVCDADKYFWVQAESFAAAAKLAHATGKAHYWEKYNALWAYSWENMVDHQYGAWYRILTSDNRPYDDNKSPAGKTDYHTMGACYEILPIVES